MLKLLLGSHGHLASGMKTSIDIFGGCERLTVIDAYVDDRIIDDDLNAFFASVNDDDQVVMLSDLYGGSVNNKMFERLARPNTYLIAGVNLALVLELLMKEEITPEELEALVVQSREMLRVVTLDPVDQDKRTIEENEDFF